MFLPPPRGPFVRRRGTKFAVRLCVPKNFCTFATPGQQRRTGKYIRKAFSSVRPYLLNLANPKTYKDGNSNEASMSMIRNHADKSCIPPGRERPCVSWRNHTAWADWCCLSRRFGQCESPEGGMGKKQVPRSFVLSPIRRRPCAEIRPPAWHPLFFTSWHRTGTREAARRRLSGRLRAPALPQMQVRHHADTHRPAHPATP